MDFSINSDKKYEIIKKGSKSAQKTDEHTFDTVSNPQNTVDIGRKTYSQISRNIFFGQQNVTIPQQNMPVSNPTKADTTTIEESLKLLLETERDCDLQKETKFLINKYKSKITTTEEVQELCDFLKASAELIKNDKLEIFDVMDPLKTGNPKESIKICNETIAKTLAVNSAQNLFSVFNKVLKSKNPKEEIELWIKLNQSVINHGLKSKYAKDIFLAETSEHFKTVNPKSYEKFMDLLLIAENIYDAEMPVETTDILNLSPEQIQNCQDYLISNPFSCEMIYDTKDLFELGQLNEKEAKKIKPFLKYNNYNKIEASTLINLAKCDEKLLQTIDFVLSNVDKENIPFSIDCSLDGWAKITKEKAAKLKNTEINKENINNLKAKLNVLAFYDDEDEINFQLKNNLYFNSFEKGDVKKLSKEELKKMTNSEFITLVFKHNNGDKLQLLRHLKTLPQSTIDKLDENIENPLIRKFLISEIEKHTNMASEVKIDTSKNYKTDKQKAKQAFEKIINNIITDKAVIEKIILPEENLLISNAIKDLNGDEIYIISKYLNDNVDFQNRYEVNEVRKEIETLLTATDNWRNCLFHQIKSKDNAEKNSFYGLLNILDAKKNNPQKYKQLKDIINLIHQGKLPRHIVSIMAENGNISELAANDLNKILNNEPIIETFSDENTAKEKTMKGDVVEVGKDLFVNNGKNLEKLKFDKETYLKLFPPVERFGFAQGEIGNCYFVSAMYDIMRLPETRIELYKIFEKQGDDIAIKFPNDENSKIVFKNGEVEYDNKKHITSAPAIQMFEYLYKNEVSKIAKVQNEMSSLEGGNQIFVYKKFSDKVNFFHAVFENKSDYNFYKKHKAEELKMLEEEITKLKDKRSKRAAQIKKGDTHITFEKMDEEKNGSYDTRIRCLQEIKECYLYRKVFPEDKITDFLIAQSKKPNTVMSCGTKPDFETKGTEEKLIYPGHAYSVYSVNEKDQTVELVNPWNCAQTIKITFEEFKQFFCEIDVMQVKN